MNLIYLGKIVNTHGIKGEIRLLSNKSFKELVFKPGFKIYIGEEKEMQIIKTYRHHKQFEMITLEGINDINLVLKYKGKNVYFNRDDLNLNGKYLLEDLINMNIIDDGQNLGVVKDILDNKAGKLLFIAFTKNYYIPYNDYYIKNVNIQKKEINTEHVKDLIL